MNAIPEKEHAWLEYQAYAFGGLVLVPKGPLIDQAEQCVELVRTEGVDLGQNRDFAWTHIAAFLAKRFEVSAQVIDKRLQKDGIPEMFDE